MNKKSLTALVNERFESDSQALPVFNRVALELMRLKESPTASRQDVADLIMKDQVLASRILQVANSSFYGGLKPIDTLSAAILRLGTEKVATLGMMAAQISASKARAEFVATRMAALWRRSYVSSSGAYWLAENTVHQDLKESAFLCGLLHDIGELFLLKVFDSLAADGQGAIQVTETLADDILDSMHNEIGYQLMLKWELPERYAQVVRDHHQPSVTDGDHLLAIIRLLDLLCKKLGVGCQASPELAPAASAEARLLGVSELQLAELEVLLEDMVSEADKMR